MMYQNFEDLFNSYISKSLSTQGSFGFDITKNIFLKASNDYSAGKIGTKELGGIATLLYYEKNKPAETHDWSDNLGGLIEEVSEIDYYKSNKDLETVNKIEKKIRKYLATKR